MDSRVLTLEMNISSHHIVFPTREVVLLGALLEAGANLSCNDSLPPYVQPADVFHATVRNISPADISYGYPSILGNDIALLPVTISSPQLFFVDIVNTFDEVLQDQAVVSGTLELVDLDAPDVKATIPITSANIAGLQYNSTTKILTLAPGDTLRLRCSWNYKTDDGHWAFERARIVDYVSDNRGGTLITHAPMNFSVTARTKLFKSINVITSSSKAFQLLFHGSI